MAGNKTFYIGKEDFKYGELDREKQRKQIHTICRAIKEGIGAELNIEFHIERNNTIRFSLFGPLDLIENGIALIQRRLRRDGLQKKSDLPEEIKPLTLENLKMHNKKLETRRQFTCTPCTETWWRWVPAHKPVSRCFKCKVRYDALRREQEYGKGTYRCDCGNIFTGKARHNVAAKCSRCHDMVYPSEIGPFGESQQRSKHGHSCEGCNHGQIYPCPLFPIPQNVLSAVVVPGFAQQGARRPQRGGQVYPHEIGPFREVQRRSRHGHSCESCNHGQIYPCPAFSTQGGSQVHESTGSTCSTFLTQQTASEYYDPIE